MTLIIISVFHKAVDPMVSMYSLFAFLMVLIREVIKDIEDVKGESTFGCITVPVVWGIEGAKVFLYLIIATGTMLLAYFLISNPNWVIRYYFLGLSPFFIFFVFKIKRAQTQRSFQELHRFCNYIILTGLISISLIK